MLKYKHMQDKRSSKRTLIPVLILIAVVFTIAIVVLFTTVFSKNSELVVLVAPSTATVRLDGRKIKNGSNPIKSGKHTLEISGDGLETKTIDFEIAKKETKSINAYALGTNGFEYYLEHDEEIERLGLVADGEAASFVKNYEKSKTILELLPLSIAKENGDKSSTLSKGDNCTRSFCLKITDDNADLSAEMKKKIESLGYNPEDYEIQYERTDTLEGEEDEE